MKQFRPWRGYDGRYYLAYDIPAVEHPDVVPCAAMTNDDGSHALIIEVLFAGGDACYFRDMAASVIREHPSWKARIINLHSGDTAAEVTA